MKRRKGKQAAHNLISHNSVKWKLWSDEWPFWNFFWTSWTPCHPGWRGEGPSYSVTACSSKTLDQDGLEAHCYTWQSDLNIDWQLVCWLWRHVWRVFVTTAASRQSFHGKILSLPTRQKPVVSTASHLHDLWPVLRLQIQTQSRRLHTVLSSTLGRCIPSGCLHPALLLARLH